MPDFGLLHCAEVELSSRLQIPAPRIFVWDKRTIPPNCERPQCLEEGPPASLGAHGRDFRGSTGLQRVCVDILHKKQGEKVWKTEKFWLDLPRVFMI